jgi:hypothetical protein
VLASSWAATGRRNKRKGMANKMKTRFMQGKIEALPHKFKIQSWQNFAL